VTRHASRRTSVPSISTRPALAVSSPASTLASVDLPHPDSPTIARVSPLRTTRSMPLRARTGILPIRKFLGAGDTASRDPRPSARPGRSAGSSQDLPPPADAPMAEARPRARIAPRGRTHPPPARREWPRTCIDPARHGRSARRTRSRQVARERTPPAREWHERCLALVAAKRGETVLAARVCTGVAGSRTPAGSIPPRRARPRT
jgi:hypothetical protein